MMDKHRQKVHAVFSRIAGRYDLMNSILSVNMDRYWRRRALQAAAPQPGEDWLDVCCGTGKLTIELQRAVGSGGNVTGLDFNAAMLDVAKRAEQGAGLPKPIRWIEGDALSLPFPDRTFDGVTIGFGLRNLPELGQGIREMRRVLKPGGRWICLELSHPVWPIFRHGHSLFVDHLVPRIGNLGLRGSADYDWLSESLRRFPGAAELAVIAGSCGLGQVRFIRLSGGIAAIHTGTRATES